MPLARDLLECNVYRLAHFYLGRSNRRDRNFPRPRRSGSARFAQDTWEEGGGNYAICMGVMQVREVASSGTHGRQ